MGGLGLTLRTRSGKVISFPIRLRLVPSTGNTHKLKIAGALLRAFLPHIPVPVRLLTDAWFMRRRLLLPLLRRHGQFIGQVRKDTVLLRDPPPKTSKRGRSPAGKSYLTPRARGRWRKSQTNTQSIPVIDGADGHRQEGHFCFRELRPQCLIDGVRRPLGRERRQTFRPRQSGLLPCRKNTGIPPARDQIQLDRVHTDLTGDVQVVLNTERTAVDLRYPYLDEFRQGFF